jgi:hypothetical protein
VLTNELASAVRRQGAIVSSVPDTDILAAADVELKGIVWPYLRNVNSDFGVREALLTPVNGRAALPRRAVGAALRHVQIVISGQYQALPQMTLEQDAGPLVSGFPGGFYVDAGAIVLIPRGTSAPLRVRYWPRPGTLFNSTDVTVSQRIITVVVGPTTTHLAVTTGPAVGGTLIDVISNASHHALLAIDSVKAFDGTGFIVPNADLFETPQVGDWVTTASNSPVVPVPEELFSPLVYLTAASLQRALGYTAEADNNQAEGMQRMQNCREALAPRIQGNPPRLVGGTFAGMGRGWGGGRGNGWGW